MPLSWLRWPRTLRNDARLRLLTPVEFRIWVNLLTYCLDYDPPGIVPAANRYLLAVELADGDEELLARALATFTRLELVVDNGDTLDLTEFCRRERIFPSPSEMPAAVAARAQRSRARRRAHPVEAEQSEPVTSASRPVTRDTRDRHEAERESESERESEPESEAEPEPEREPEAEAHHTNRHAVHGRGAHPPAGHGMHTGHQSSSGTNQNGRKAHSPDSPPAFRGSSPEHASPAPPAAASARAARRPAPPAARRPTGSAAPPPGRWATPSAAAAPSPEPAAPAPSPASFAIEPPAPRLEDLAPPGTLRLPERGLVDPHREPPAPDDPLQAEDVAVLRLIPGLETVFFPTPVLLAGAERCRQRAKLTRASMCRALETFAHEWRRKRPMGSFGWPEWELKLASWCSSVAAADQYLARQAAARAALGLPDPWAATRQAALAAQSASPGEDDACQAAPAGDAENAPPAAPSGALAACDAPADECARQARSTPAPALSRPTPVG